MHDLELRLEHRPGTLATLGETLAAVGVSLEGGGVFLADGAGLAHFLVEDGDRAARALGAAGIEVAAVREVLLTRLDQDRPGQLGALCRAMAEAGIDVEVQYSDHDGRLVLVVDDPDRGRRVCARWEASVGQP